MKIRIENEYTYEAEIDFDKLTEAFEDEWVSFMGDALESPDDDDKNEFVQEMVSEMGARYFISEVEDLDGTVRDDHNLCVRVVEY